jgi:4'-phosphopantetheinyl transferase
MRLLLYTTEYQSQLLPEYLRLLVDKLPPTIQMKALRYRRWQDTYGCIFGNHLLRIALKKMQYPDDLSRLQYSRYHKPFLPGGPYFNISHSGNRVVCLMSKEKEVGIDIEYAADDVSFDDFQKQFTHAEWSGICSANAPKYKFYQLWTAKESVIKADGRGLNIPLQHVDVSTAQMVLLDGRVWRLSRLSLFDRYACHFSVENSTTVDYPGSSELFRLGFSDLEFYEIMPTSILDE